MLLMRRQWRLAWRGLCAHCSRKRIATGPPEAVSGAAHFTNAAAARQPDQSGVHDHCCTVALQELESQEDVLRLMPQALQLLRRDAAGGGDATAAGLSRQLAETLQHATLSGATTVSMLVPLQQLLWMLTAFEQKVPPPWLQHLLPKRRNPA